jgi:hypothetical protein
MKYKVMANVSYCVEIEVESESEEAARDKAQEECDAQWLYAVDDVGDEQFCVDIFSLEEVKP